MRPTLAALTLPLLLAAFHNDPAPPAETGDFELVLSPGVLSAARGGSGSVTVTVVPKSGFTQAVAFSVVGAPSTLGASFAPPASTAQSILTLNVPGSLEPSPYTLFVKGSATVNGALVEHTAPLKLTVLPPPGLTVGGRVRNALGLPLVGAVVRLGGQTTTTDAEGRFSVPEVEAPYTVTVKPAGQSLEHEFVNLTRPDPTLVLSSVSGGAPPLRKATVSGTLGGTPFPVPAGRAAGVAFAADGDARGGAALAAGKGPDYSLEASWGGSGSVSGTLYALSGTLNPAVPTLFGSYSGFATRDVTLSGDTPVSGQNLALSPVQNSALSAKIALPSGATLAAKRLFLSLGPRSFFLLGLDPSAALVNTYPTPVLPGKTLGLVVDAKQGTRAVTVQRTGLAANQVLDLTLPAAVAPQTPAGGAVNVPHTVTLDWSDVPGSVYVLMLGGANKVVYTASSLYSAALTTASSYTWGVTSLGPFSSLDDFASPRWAGGYPSPGDDQEYVVTSSEGLSFKTAP